MIKNISRHNFITTPFPALKGWHLSNVSSQDLVLTELTGSEEPVALEYLDYTIDPPEVNRDCNIALEQQSSDLAIPEEGISSSGIFFPDSEPTNIHTGTFKRLMYSQIQKAFYNSYRNPTQIFGMENIDFSLSGTNRFLSNEFLMFTIPQIIFGDRMGENTIRLIDNSFDDNMIVTDDGQGNLLAGYNLFSKVQEVRSLGNIILTGSSGFECYPVTSSWSTGSFGDNFEAYATGTITTESLNSGTGFSGPWQFGPTSVTGTNHGPATESISFGFIGGENDNKLFLKNAQAARPISADGNWNTIRIGIRYYFDDGAGMSSTPRFVLGMINNPSTNLNNGPLSSTSSHFVGIRSDAASWVPTTNVYDMGGSMAHVFEKYGTNIITGSVSEVLRMFGKTSIARRPALYLEITKGSPNYTIQTLYQHSGTAGVDIDSGSFIFALATASLSQSNTIIGSAFDPSMTQSFAVNEAQGALNAICLAWDRTDVGVYISDVYFNIMS